MRHGNKQPRVPSSNEKKLSFLESVPFRNSEKKILRLEGEEKKNLNLKKKIASRRLNAENLALAPLPPSPIPALVGSMWELSIVEY